ncbi:MAG: pilus (MSHA type) biogenesis protein MshL [bacterium]|nr:pilus (MSHA type) biogenesis protein MshL [bacterium]
MRFLTPQRLLAGVLACGLACASPPQPAPTVQPDTSRGRFAERLPPDVQDALLPDLATEDPSPIAPEARFDVSVVDAPAGEFFASLVEGTPFNMVIDPKVSGRISLSLKSVTLREVLEATRDAYGYAYRTTPYGFHVMPGGLSSRVFTIDYLNIERFGTSLTRVSSGQVSETGSASGDTEDGTSSDGDGVVSGSMLDTRTRADFWTELIEALNQLLGGREGRSVVPSPQAGLVVVRANPAELREVEAFLTTVERSLHRQVILEAKILEVELNDEYRAGVNWAQLITHNDARYVFGPTGMGDLPDSTVSDIAAGTGVLNPDLDLPIDDLLGTLDFGGAFTIAAAANHFLAFIQLLETQGRVHILSSPRISTVNNQKAVIKVGNDEFFVTDVSSTTVTGTATTTTPDIELTPFFSGIALDVTPQISENDDVILHIHPSVSKIVDQTKTVTVGGEIQSLPLAFSTIRESDTVVRARSGELVVIGGLMEDIETDDTAGLPIASRIPMLGRAFRQEADSRRKVELVILLRPTVVKHGTWGTMLEDTRERLGSMSDGADQLLPSEGYFRAP